jgi:hypothetical protein
MGKQKFYKTLVTVEVLHEGPIEFDDLKELSNMINSGDCSGQFKVMAAEPLTPKQMAEECLKQQSDPEFFDLDENGEDLN